MDCEKGFQWNPFSQSLSISQLIWDCYIRFHPSTASNPAFICAVLCTKAVYYENFPKINLDTGICLPQGKSTIYRSTIRSIHVRYVTRIGRLTVKPFGAIDRRYTPYAINIKAPQVLQQRRRQQRDMVFNSAAYAKDLNEVKRLGGRNSAVRTADQTASAIFSTISPVVLWNTPSRAAAAAKGNSLIENARLFALLNFAGSDAYIAGYEVKYKYKLWRPVTAIPNAAALGNLAVTPNPNWEPLIVTPLIQITSQGTV